MADFFDRVLSQLRYATNGEKESIRAELEGHVQDHAEALERAGCDRETAREQAVEAMGDPEAIGRALSREYTRFWLVLSRAAAAALALLCLMAVMTMPTGLLYRIYSNLSARLDPGRQGEGNRDLTGLVVAQVDVRAEVGNDILRVYQTAYDPAENEATVWVCNYDQRPFGIASHLLYNMVRAGSWGGGGGGNSGAYYWRFDEIPLEPGQDSVTLEYHQYGVDVSLEVPIAREVAE